MKFGRAAFLVPLTLSLAACNLPRGAGVQSEVLAVQTGAGGEQVAPDFGVVPVTRAVLPQIGQWPAVGPGGYDWIRRQEQSASLLIAPGDQVNVTVWDTAENSLITGPGQRAVTMQAMQVSSAGEVFLPFVGTIRVAGMSAATARARIEEEYASSIPAAQVQLSVEPGRANTANLVAGVASPGVYPLADRDVTILSLLSLGGGVNPGLPNPQVRLFRGDHVYGIALSRLYDDPALDTTLMGGDRVIVEAESRAFLSLGAAGSQSRHVFPTEVVTALDALALIGGVNEARADPQGVLVLRDYPAAAVRADGIAGPAHERMVFVLDLTSADGLFSAGAFQIMPNDLVYATESPVNAARTVMGIIGSVFGLTRQAEAL